jgi:hypothetical protein
MMPPVFPDVEAMIIRFLRERLPAGIEYGTFVPHDYDGSSPFVMVHRIGGFMKWPALDNATVEIEVWSESREHGHDVAQLVVSELMGTRLTGQPFARVVVIAGLVYMVEDLSELSQWVGTYQISVRPERG